MKMDEDYLTILITICILGGVVVLALLAVCITKITADRSLKKSLAKSQIFGETVSQPSYVRYNDPEPQTPVGLAPENPWDFPAYHANPALETYAPDFIEDTPDHVSLHAPPPDSPRRPSSGQYRRPSVQNIPRRSSYVQDMPRRPSYAQGVQRGIQRRPSTAQGMPRSRHSYAPDLGRRPSQAVQRRSSVASQRPHPPTGENKLWFNYLKEDPNYFKQEVLERNKSQPRVWQGRDRGVPPPEPHYALDHLLSDGSQQDFHRQAAARLSWI